uniref:AraC family transcriptional regulator n=1 Tax=Chryseobacterium endophyticum TaxID=1854762 RepID=A0AAU6WU71_9FLAO
MKIQKEIIEFEEGKSFKLFSPSLKNCFFWHYHPETELVYVEASNGIRHVGKNISDFKDSDLLLIGSNVPHLNFDYKIQTECKQLVLQMRENFLQEYISPCRNLDISENCWNVLTWVYRFQARQNGLL